MNHQSKMLERLELASPWMNASGFLGYSPPAQAGWAKPMGAFVTNAISLLPRKPALLRQVNAFPGGFMLHTGLPSLGLQNALRQYAERWSKIPIPVWVHLLPQAAEELPQLIEPLEDLENVGAVELGLPPGISLKTILEFIRAGGGEKPLMVCLCVDEIQSEWLPPMEDAGATGVVLSAPRGMLKTGNRLSRGRLYGPAIFPYMLNVVCRLAQFDVPVIAGGGIYSEADGETLLEAGAAAVQLDAVLWRNWDA